MKRSELQERLARNHSTFTEFIGGLSDVVANNSLPGKWTPNQQLSHIHKSVKPVKLAVTMPKFMLSALFGKSKRASVTYDELVINYKAKLAAGGKSSPQYLPDPSYSRNELMKTLQKNVETLSGRLERFSEEELDRYMLPHPLLGKLTLREMIYFTLYHVEHHHLQVNPALRKSAA